MNALAFGAFMDLTTDDRTWAFEQFASADFGDVRRRARAELMVRRVVASPSGRLSEVFRCNAELQGAYDFVEGVVPPAAIMESIAAATCAQIGQERVFVLIDGTSLTLTDRNASKGFGAIGARGLVRGLKVVDALAVSEEGVPIGLVNLHWWARRKAASKSRYWRRREKLTETHDWLAAIETTARHLKSHAPSSSPCFVIDREGDCAAILRAVAREEGFRYIVRAAQDRRLAGKRRRLRAHLGRQHIVGTRTVDVPAGPGRSARVAVLDVRSARVVLDLPDRTSAAANGRMNFETNVVWAVERRPPRGEKGLDWLLITNEPVTDLKAANQVLDGYCLRWRVEDFHKTWKSGRCNVERTQLRTKEHVIRWATLLATVATRVEQLKHLARTTPDAPASLVLSAIEIEALKAAKHEYKSRTEVIPEGMPTIGLAVRWIADLGGFTGKSSGGPPGSITIARGLEYLGPWTAGFAAARATQRTRKK